MNISKIIDMIRDDPALPDDVPAFLKRVNEKNIEKVVKTRVEIVEETIMVSFAEQHGGEATERDVQDAVKLLAREPLLAETKAQIDKTLAAISCDEVKTLDEAIAKFGEK